VYLILLVVGRGRTIADRPKNVKFGVHVYSPLYTLVINR